MTFKEKMDLALALYEIGEPVVLKENGGKIIHGEETLAATDLSKCRVIDGIDVDEWETSYWPEVLESARQWSLKNTAAKKSRT